MKYVKDTCLSLFTRKVFFQKTHYLLINALAAFSFDAPGVLLTESEVWETLMKARPGMFLDFGLPKPRGEFMAEGACHTPGRTPLHSCPVSIRVGEVKKNLLILGDRAWTRRKDAFANLTDPAPFTSMPIVWERAFGGPGHPGNKAGTGFADPGRPVEEERIVMPNVEYSDQLFVSPLKAPSPACFGSTREVRTPDRKRFGTYDDAWLAEEWPGAASDYDFELDCWASPDQMAKGFFAGDEIVEIVNMHPDREHIATRLPGKRVRFFLEIEGWCENHRNFHEATANLDTVWLFPEQGRGVLVWRGWQTFADEENVNALVLAAMLEDLTEPVRPSENYKLLLESPASPPEGAAPSPQSEETDKTADTQSEAAAQPESEPAQAPPPSGPTLQDLQADMRREMEREFSKMGISPVILAMKPKDVEMTLGGLMDKGLAQASERLEKMGLDPTLLAEDQAGEPESYEAALASVKKLGAAIAKSVEGLKSRLNVAGEVSLKTASDEEAPSPEAMSRALAALGLAPESMERLQKTMAEVQAALNDAERKITAQNPPEPEAAPPRAPEPPEAPLSGLDREAVAARRALGQTLSGLDMTGADLSEMDLSGADISGSILEKARLDKANLSGARLSGAVLVGSSAHGAVFDRAVCVALVADGMVAPGASFLGANLDRARLNGVNFSSAKGAGASLNQADMTGADLTGADFAGCRAEAAIFSGIAAKEAVFSGAVLTNADFSRACLEKADFSKIDGRGAKFTEATGTGVIFRQARLDKSRCTGGGVFAGADFMGAALEDAVWLDSALSGANFAEARLSGSRFDGCRLEKACLVRSVARGAGFNKADLSEADMRGMDLFQAALRRARLIGARIDKANLFGADLFKATLTGISLEGTNIGRTRLALRPPLGRKS